MLKRLFKYFSNPIRLAVLNGVLIALMILSNICFQAFCIPTTWAMIVLTICFVNAIISPIISKNKRLVPFTGFINGISLFVFVYCIIFTEVIPVLGILLLIVPLFGWVINMPYFFVAQIVWNNLIKPVSNVVRYSFLLAVFVCTLITFYVGYEYKKAIASIELCKQSNYTQLEKNFMTEKILGMHFIYHTRICIYDGWRPPKHEPALVVGLWFTNWKDPLDIDLKTRLELYKKFFPERTYKFECSCAIGYSKNYHNDNLWK